ncbi:MAG: hypothetical protein HOH43_20895 [Candidatus Latescibacteria bacterium]|jgi:hypothetical protein|nr:hypothetical protein [Candidatus Latescibacterota bacterium]
MTLTMKVALFLAILVMDAIGGLLVIRKLKTEGKSSGIPVILVAMVMSLLVIGVVLFTVV